jgi:hypothetical protein
MEIRYVEPLRRAWTRTRGIVFPFRLETWLVLGFAAFLSEWMSGSAFPGRGGGGGGGGHAGWHGGWHGGMPRPHDLLPAFVWGPLVAAIVVVALVAAIVFLWIGSRGKFVFLDDVVRQRAAIVEPWGRCARLGNSLFLWKLVFGFLAGLGAVGIVVATMGSALLAWWRFETPFALAPEIALGATALGILLLAWAFVNLMLDSFVVPIMYREGISTNAAWGRFLPLLRDHTGAFVMYALFVLVLCVALGAAVAVAGFGTCCVGFFLLLGPYVGQVLMLPVYVTYRGFGPEFLAQFGPAFDVFVTVPASTPAAPPQA